MFRWDVIAYLPQRCTVADSHKSNVVPKIANAACHFDEDCMVIIRCEVSNHPDNVGVAIPNMLRSSASSALSGLNNRSCIKSR
jgi:hypothetical protein